MARNGRSIKCPTQPTIKRLFALSSNCCAFDGCQTTLVDRKTGIVVGEVCHIKGDKPGSARYDRRQDDADRHSFDNLIILCSVHHKIIDSCPKEFSTRRLQKMKKDHEASANKADAPDSVTSALFTEAAIAQFRAERDIVHAGVVSGGQVAHTINNHYAPAENVETVQLEGRATCSVGLEIMHGVGCPCLILTVICRSKRPAKIRRALITLVDQGIVAALEKGFEKSFDYTPLPGSKEELSVDLIPMQQLNDENGFVIQQDEAAKFLLPILAAPVGLFLMRPAEASSLEVQLFDDSKQTVVSGETLKPQLEDLVRVSRKYNCRPKFGPVNMQVSVKSTTMPELMPVGITNPNPVHFGLQVDQPQNVSRSDVKDERPWFYRTGRLIEYPQLLQGNLPYCVYAAIAGAVNHLTKREVWTPSTLFEAHQRDGSRQADFGVASTAIAPVAGLIEQQHHNLETASAPLTPEIFRNEINAGAVVIVSMELRKDPKTQRGGWHMFSLVACDQELFQVWDTNGLSGFLTADELLRGFFYPNGWYFMPHDKQDTLILRRKVRRPTLNPKTPKAPASKTRARK